MVEHQAGIPVRMKPRSGHRSEAPACGHVVQAHMAPLHATDGSTSLVAARARDSADNRPKLAATRLQWSPRVPATVSDAPAARAQAASPTMAPRLDGDRARVVVTSIVNWTSRRA